MKSAPKRLWILLTLLGFAGLLKATLPQTAIGAWTPAGSLAQARSNAAAVLLADGRILITGGDGASGPLQPAEFFATDGAVSPAASMNVARSGHFAVALSDGRVLVGGGNSGGGGATNSAEIYDPSSDSWTLTNPLTQARAGATAALLQDGRVLVAGGDNGGYPSNTVEIYDPSTGSFSFAGTLSSPRTKHAMTVLQDGRVLIAGGFDGNTPLATSDIFDPSTGNISAGPSLSVARYGHSATTLLDGRVAVIGGAGQGSNGTVDLASVEVFDPASGTFSASAINLATAREGHQAFLLPNNNNVLIVGGTSAGQVVAASELFTPQISSADGSWSYAVAPTGSNVTPRSAATGSPMQQDGLLLTAGGSDAAGNALAGTELYAFPTVKTDQADYAPGSVVTITGSGWQPGETVTLTLVESPLIDTHPAMTAVADGNGNIFNNQFSPDIHDTNVRFYLTAVGGQSALQAGNTFTDAKPNTVTVGTQSPNSIAPGGTTTYTVTVNFNGNGSSCTSPLSVTTALPTGATASFSPTSVTSTGGNVTSTLTITTSNATPPGSTLFTVLAANGGGTCQSGTASGSGTLVVVEPTTTTLTSSVNPTVFGQSTTLTATVAQTVGPTTPTGGTVTFLDGVNSLGTATLNNGTATLSVSTLTPGSHSLTASYAGVANTFGSSTSSAVTQTVNQASTTTTIARTTGPNPSVFGQPVTFTATVNPVAPGAGTPTGNVTFRDAGNLIATVSLTGNTATLNTSTLLVGSRTLTATYNADSNFALSTSSSLAHTVNQASTTTSITSHTPSPSVVGQAVAINFAVAVVAPGSGTPTGTVTVSDGAQSCTGSVASGTCSIVFATAGTKSLTASYSGDTNFTASTSSPATSHTVNAAATTTTITAHTPNPSLVNQAITVNFTVTANAPGSGIPTGNVTVSDGTGDTCSGAVAAGTCQLTATTTGAKTLTASYATDGNFASSTSAGVAHTVGQAPAITSANSTAFTVNTAGSFTVTATGFPAPTFSETGALPSGVTFTSAGVLSGTPALGTVGTYPITITATNGVGTDATQNFTLTVNKAATTLTVTPMTGPQSAPYGGNINLIATLSSGGNNLSNQSVSFSVNGNAAGSATTNNNGQAKINNFTLPLSITVSTYPTGIQASFAGDANYLSASGSAALTVVQATPAFSGLTPSQSINYGAASVTLSGTISATSNGNTVYPPAGETVTITINGVPTPAAIGNNGAFSAAVNTHTIPASASPYTITYSYAGDTNFSTATNTATTLTVNKATSSTTLVSSLNPSFFGQQVTFTATVTVATGVPTGSVQFQDGGVNLGSPVALVNNGGVFTAQLQTSSLSVGTHNVTALYGGDGNFNGSTSNTIAQVVQNPATTTTVTSSLNPSNYGQSVMFTATVTSQAGTPTGSVIFYDGACGLNPLSGSLALDGAGKASFLTSALNAGLHTVFACFTHTGIFLDSNGSVSQQVNQATLTITASNQSKNYGQTLALGNTAFTTAGLVSPDTVASVTLSSAGAPGTAPAGTYAIVPGNAAGSGLANYNITYSNGTLTVNPAGLTITANDVTKTYGQTVTFTGTEFTANGLLNSDSVASVTLTSAGAPASATVTTYPIVPSAAAGSGLSNYTISYVNGTLTVLQATPSLLWNTPADITYGTPLTGVQLNATSSVNSGVFVYSPAAGTVLTAGTHTLSVLFTPTDTLDYTSNSATVQINVSRATPTIFWQKPADITYGTSLSSTQLNALALPTAAMGYWKGEGDATDAIAGNDGTFPNGTFATGVAGGQAFLFDGTRGVSIPSSPGYDINAPGFTAAFWVQGNPYNNGTATLLENSYNGSTGWAFNLDSSTGYVEFDIGTGNNSFKKASSNVNVLDGSFHYVIGTWDSSTNQMDLFVDGVPAGPVSAQPANSGGGVTIGFSAGSGTPSQFFQGVVDEVEIFSQPLVPGTFVYTPASGTKLSAGTGQTLSVNFTPNDTADLNSANASVQINVSRANQTISFAALSNKTYGDPDFTVSANSDSGLAVSFAASGNCAVSANTVHITAAGSCTITASQAGDSNYNPATDVPQSFAINQATVTPQITAQNKTYDGNEVATILTRTLSGVIGTDDVSLTGGTATFADKNTGTHKLVTATGLSLAGTTAGNYVLSSPTATTYADITALHITGSFAASNKVYDATTSASVSARTLNGAISGDDVSLSGGTATFSDKKVGTGKTVTLTGATLNGTDAGNYVLDSVATTTADITALAVLGSITAANKVYDGTTTATINTRTLSGVIAGDMVSYVGGTATFSDKNVGVGKTVTAVGLSLSGPDAGNYTVNTTASTTANITPAPLTITAKNQTKTYGQTFIFAGTEFTTSGLFSGDSVASVTLTSAGAAATATVTAPGPNYTITPSAAVGTGLSNYTISYQSGTLTVTQATPAVVVVSSANPSLLNAPVTFTATVTPPYSGMPTGTVTFKDGTTTIGSSSLNGSGMASSTTSTLAVNSHSITAVYSGDGNFTSSTSSAVNQLVQYQSGGMCAGDVGHAIRQPINSTGDSVFPKKQGSTVPAKFRVCDANGTSIGTPGVVSDFRIVKIAAGTVISTPNELVDSTTPDSAFRFDPSGGQWIFNISTKNYSAGSTYFFRILLNDGTNIDFDFGLK